MSFSILDYSTLITEQHVGDLFQYYEVCEVLFFNSFPEKNLLYTGIFTKVYFLESEF